jgi:hypothetical protein
MQKEWEHGEVNTVPAAKYRLYITTTIQNAPENLTIFEI